MTAAVTGADNARLPGALVIGGGPAGLMAAQALLSAGVPVTLAEAKPTVGRKFLMAGKSGLNLSRMEARGAFLAAYGDAAPRLEPILDAFGPEAVRAWAEGLGQDCFTGSTGRLFPVAMKASPLLRAWLARLQAQGLDRRLRWRWQGWDDAACRFDTPEGPQRLIPRVTVLALGGASWARLGSDGAWARHFAAEGLPVTAFAASNAAIAVDWSAHMRPHFGAPLKGVAWHAGETVSRGEAVITARGLEGGGVYTLSPALREGAAPTVDLTLDLAPDLELGTLRERLSRQPAKTRLSHWLRNTLRLTPAKIALFHEMTAGGTLPREDWAARIKALPIRHAGLRPIDEAISTVGGVPWAALGDGLMLKDRPGTFCAGEMIDWDAPTGGYLLTACLATGRWAGQHAAQRL